MCQIGSTGTCATFSRRGTAVCPTRLIGACTETQITTCCTCVLGKFAKKENPNSLREPPVFPMRIKTKEPRPELLGRGKKSSKRSVRSQRRSRGRSGSVSKGVRPPMGLPVSGVSVAENSALIPVCLSLVCADAPGARSPKTSTSRRAILRLVLAARGAVQVIA